MLLAEAEETLIDQIINGFGTNSIVYILENAPTSFTPQQLEAEKVECEINTNQSTQASLGGVGTRRFRRRGDIIMRVHTPIKTGTRRDKQIKDIILNLFEGKNFGGIVTETITFLKIGPVGDWFLTTVRIPFYFHTEDI